MLTAVRGECEKPFFFLPEGSHMQIFLTVKSVAPFILEIKHSQITLLHFRDSAQSLSILWQSALVAPQLFI